MLIIRPLPFNTVFKVRELGKIRMPITSCSSSKNVSVLEVVKVWLMFK